MRTSYAVALVGAIGMAALGASRQTPLRAQDPAPPRGPQLVVYKSPT